MEKLTFLRYKVIRQLSFPMPLLSSNVPFLGGKTVPEVAVIVLVAIIFLVVACRGSLGTSGTAAQLLASAAILGSLRILNVYSIIFGISFERAIFWHKSMVALFVACIVVHSVTNVKAGNIDKSGIILTVLFGAMILSYILKYLLFEAFYYVHVTVFFAVNIVAIIHGAIIIPICGLVWLLDLLLRYGITAKHVELKAALLPGNIIHIKFNKAFNYTPGQYIFLRISDVDPLQYHPFTIASAPHQEQTSLYLRPLGDWTGRLLKLINASVTSDSAVTSDGIEMGTVSAATDSNLTMPAYTILRAIVEGPYGITSVNFNDPEYQVVLLIAGGIGATPMLSIYHDLIQQARTGRSFRKVMLAWSVKDIAMIDSIDKSSCVGNSKIYSICRPPDFVSSLDGVDSKLMSESETINAESAFVTELYSSSLKGSARDQSIKDMPVKVGRPRIPDLFAKMKDLCQKEGLKRVAVGVCGPNALMNEVFDLCRSSQLSCDTAAVHFDCHKEVFDL